MDILTMMFSSKLRVGLKEMQATMHYQNVQEYDGDFEEFLDASEIDKMIAYNVNDVESTVELLNRLDNYGKDKNKSQIELRRFIEKEYNIDAYSMDSVAFGQAILAKKICEEMHIDKKQLKQMRSPMDYIPLKDVILPIIKYENPILQGVLEDMKGQIVYSKERKGYEKKFVLSNVRYSVGVGGIHSLHTPEIFVPGKDEVILHLDVASMYPSFIVQYGWFPRHLGKAGLTVYTQIYHERIDAKHSGQKLKSDALKLTLNSVTGKMQEETSWMYDPFSVFKIRINGQLVLLMLVDRLLKHSCKIVQVNTDGVMCVAKKASIDQIMSSVAELEKITRLTFEADRYEAFYQYAGNDYFGVIDGYSQSGDQNLIEKKGSFITETLLGKGLAPTIIPKAVINYFIKKIPVEDTIRNCHDIREFLIGQRVGKQFSVVHGTKPVQRINRFYASTNGAYLFKVKPGETPENMLTKSGVTILNKFDDLPIESRKINYRYYISEANKKIAEFTEQQLSLF
jgi:DNA polymerase